MELLHYFDHLSEVEQNNFKFKTRIVKKTFSQICFLRVSRPATPVVYSNDEVFSIGKAKVVRKSDSDQVLVVAAGVTLHEALKAADTLAEKVCTTELSSPLTVSLSGNQHPRDGPLHRQAARRGRHPGQRRRLQRQGHHRRGSLP